MIEQLAPPTAIMTAARATVTATTMLLERW
jgi:hypothetical protein